MSETVMMEYSYIFLSFLGKETKAVNKLRTFSKGKSICIVIKNFSDFCGLKTQKSF